MNANVSRRCVQWQKDNTYGTLFITFWRLAQCVLLTKNLIMKTIEIKQKLVEEALDQLKAAQQDSYVQSTQNVIDELELALRQPLGIAAVSGWVRCSECKHLKHEVRLGNHEGDIVECMQDSNENTFINDRNIYEEWHCDFFEPCR